MGGSFNPAHEGHREISLVALAALGLDEVWWLVTPGNPLKEKALYADYDERMAHADKVANHAKIKISDFERQHHLTYTIDTITALQSIYTDCHFVWLIGADNLAEFHLWRNWEEIGKIIPIAVMNRPDYKHDALSSPAAMQWANARLPVEEASVLYAKPTPAWVFIPDTENFLSSTQIRKEQLNMRSQIDTGKTDMVSGDTSSQQIAERHSLAHFLDFNPPESNFLSDVITGLGAPQKSLSPKYFYDANGSAIFQKITETKDYYPTRTELALMHQHLPSIQEALGARPAIFEYGSGASEKIRLLIEELDDLQTYVAMDISRAWLLESAATLARDYPGLAVSAVCADFQQSVTLPDNFHPEVQTWTGYFPGSTIGNFSPGTVQAFFGRINDTLGESAKFLLGFDLIKDVDVLNRAYNDSEGASADFNINLLHRMQRELGARLNVDDFAHHAFYNEMEQRIEMHLRAVRPTEIVINDQAFVFLRDESLLTEYSYKYTKEIMEGMVDDTPWGMSHFWTDDKGWFAVCLLGND